MSRSGVLLSIPQLMTYENESEVDIYSFTFGTGLSPGSEDYANSINKSQWSGTPEARVLIT